MKSAERKEKPACQQKTASRPDVKKSDFKRILLTEEISFLHSYFLPEKGYIIEGMDNASEENPMSAKMAATATVAPTMERMRPAFPFP